MTGVQTTPKERPILFSAAMVRAILNDESPKTQTRRIIKPQPTIATSSLDGVTLVMQWRDKVNTPLVIGPDCLRSLCPYGQPGDHLWVRETWTHFGGFLPDIGYRATGEEAAERDPDFDHWRPSIFMPRWASRITLEIVNVRAERLQAITDADILAEGFPADPPSYAEGLAGTWNKINGDGAWESDPWVWVVEFRRVRP